MARGMYNGYVHTIIDKNQSFEEAIWTFARAFGALILMRDDPMDAPVPERFEPADYYPKKVMESQKEIDGFLALTADEKESIRQKEIADYQAKADEALIEDQKEFDRLNALLTEAYSWNPQPERDYSGIKSMVVETLEKAIKDNNPSDDNYYKEQIRKLQNLTPVEFALERELTLRRAVTSATTNLREEQERVDGRNAWIKGLRESLVKSTAPVAEKEGEG